MHMPLNTEEASTTRPAVAKRSSAPRKRLNGVQVPVHVVDLLEEIRAAENEAYVAMGGESKKSLSEIASEAFELYIAEWVTKHGAIPREGVARRDFIKKLAASNLEELRAELLTKQ